MDREATEFGKSVRSQVRIAAWAIGKTLGTATRVAAPRIELQRLKKKEAVSRQMEWQKGKAPFVGTKYFGGKPKDITIYARTITEARKDIRAQNYRFGLAKLSWRASIGGLGSQAGMGVSKANAKTLQKAMQRAAVARNLKGDNPSIMIGSYLPYAQDALIGGPSAIAPAIDRAARMMMIIMNDKAAKAVKRMATA
jgi:hypothetical protein